MIAANGGPCSPCSSSGRRISARISAAASSAGASSRRTISPGKTWAGVYGALVAGALVALVGGWLLGLHGGKLLGLLVLSVVTVAASIVGDLLESLMKRHAAVKDSGSLFPGHGGLLDRLDSVFAAMPVFAAGMLLLSL